MTPLKAMKQALEALEWANNCPSHLSRVPAAIINLCATITEMEKAEPTTPIGAWGTGFLASVPPPKPEPQP